MSSLFRKLKISLVLMFKKYQRSLTAERAYCIKLKFIISSEKPF